nr:unnamed protein product [Digitaria exilis]
MPVAVGDVAAAAPAPVAERGCLLLFCVGALFSAGVAALVVARAACGERCPDVLLIAAMSLVVAALAMAVACSVAMLLLSHYVLDADARGQMAAATQEALAGGSTVLALGKLASAAFISAGLVALFVKVSPPMKRWERVSSVALDAGALCMSALFCFVVIPTFAIRMWRRV